MLKTEPPAGLQRTNLSVVAWQRHCFVDFIRKNPEIYGFHRMFMLHGYSQFQMKLC